MPLAGIGAAVAGGADAAVGLGAADATFGAFDAGLFAANTADVAAGGFGVDLASAAVPDLAAGGLDAANATFGTFSPDLFAANSADVATGGFGVDLGAAGVPSDLAAGGSGVLGGDIGTFGAPASGVLDTPTAEFFGGAPGETFTGEGFGPGATDIANNFGAPFSQEFGGPSSGFLGGEQPVGSFGTGESSTIGQADIGEQPATFDERFDALKTPTPSSDSVVSDQGVVSSQDRFGDTFRQFSQTNEGANLPTPMAERGGLLAPEAPSPTVTGGGLTGGGTFPTPQAGILDPNFLQSAQIQGLPTSMDTGAFVPTDPSGAFVNAPPGQFTPTTEFDPTVSAGGPNPTIANVGGGVTPTAPGATPGAPGATPTAPGATPTAPGATPAAPTTVAGAPTGTGGLSPLTALRGATLGMNAITAGINLNNALNQPSYPALMPIAYPGSPFAPSFGNTVAPGSGGIAGGLAGNRLVNGLVAGNSAQQLAESGIITPSRAAGLESTYQGITQQYAQQLGVSPQSLSPGVKRMIAARALGEMQLGGR